MSFDLKIENNDISINPDGSVKTVRNNDKLIQDVLKIILTPQGSNKFYNWYGSTLCSRIIGEVMSPFLTKIEIRRSIEESLNNLMLLQQNQAIGQFVSVEETLAAIKDILIEKDQNDPRAYNIIVSVLTKKLSVLDINFQLRV